MGFNTVSDNTTREISLREDLQENRLEFGVKFLDDITGGILKTDLVLLGGRSGSGKSELANIIATHNAMNNKKVHMFALEAEDCEFERRLKYRVLAYFAFKDNVEQDYTYLDWVLGNCEFLNKYDDKANAYMKRLNNLNVFYRKSSFDLNEFTKIFNQLQSSDLIVIDHLHYFDFDSSDENRAFTDIIKTIRDMALLKRVPIILVAHLKKPANDSKELCPDIEAFQGSSNIYKIPSKIITIASAGYDMINNMPATFMRVPKFRMAGERTHFVGKLFFNSALNKYSEGYMVGLDLDGQYVIPPKKPTWVTC